MSITGRKFVWFGLGISAGVVLFRTLKRMLKGLVERPPIIIKGGSLIFQSGSKGRGRMGWPWKVVATGKWTPHHPSAGSVDKMYLTLRRKHGCHDLKRAEITSIRVRWDDGGGVRTFELMLQTDSSGKRIPVVEGSLDEAPDRQFPRLQRPGSGSVFQLTYVQNGGNPTTCDTKRAEVDFD